MKRINAYIEVGSIRVVYVCVIRPEKTLSVSEKKYIQGHIQWICKRRVLHSRISAATGPQGGMFNKSRDSKKMGAVTTEWELE